MALTHFAFLEAGFMKRGVPLSVADAESVISEGIVPSASNQQTAAATLPIVRIATDTAVYVAFGSNPNASTGTTARFYLPANGVEHFQIEIGNKVAVVTA